jgi:hypothetical protein
MVRLHDVVRAGVRIAVCARVEAYRPSPPEADLLLLVQEERIVDGARVPIEPVRVEGVPVSWPGGGGRTLTMGLEVGDEVIALVRHRSHDEIDSGEPGPVVPVSTRRMSYSDILVLAEYRRPSEERPASEYRSDGQPVLAMPTGEALHVGASTAALALARADLVLARLEALATAFDAWVPAPGDGGAAFKTILSALTGSGWPEGVSSDRVKVTS